MYADIFGTLPVAEALVAKGVGLGTVLIFVIVVTGIMAIGFLFNAFRLWLF
ncbi:MULTISPECIES: hypothetical protein [Rheinheimera]|uniref:Uncharacterized protein n=1 Tax=Rheinheimera marina TaxID=1774958 RepID=A0ABV9JPL4_9GAMM